MLYDGLHHRVEILVCVDRCHIGHLLGRFVLGHIIDDFFAHQSGRALVQLNKERRYPRFKWKAAQQASAK